MFGPSTADTRKSWNWLTRRGIRTILDIGANVGQFAAEIHQVLPNAMIYSFEPLRDCYEQLVANMKGAGNFRAFHFALGDENWEAQMHRSEFSPSSSLLSMAELHKKAFPFTRMETRDTVPVKRLDDVAGDLTLSDHLLVKIDVQGYEDRVIAGGRNTISRADILIVETSFQSLYEGQALFANIFDALREIGFRYHGSLDQIRDPRDGRILQADSIFLREDASIAPEEDESIDWERRGRPAPPPPVVKEKTIREYARKASIGTFIETGTLLGDMVEASRNAFDRLWSVELDEALFQRARQRFSEWPRIAILRGDSGQVLGELLPMIKEPALFWLDGHYSGVYQNNQTAKGVRETPIAQELEHILAHPVTGHVILIDDARLFVGCNDYPTIAGLREIIATKHADWVLDVKDDIIRIHSAHDLPQCCPLPWIRPVETLVYSRYVAERDGVDYWTRVYDGGDVIYKQSTSDLACHEAEVLSRLKSDYVPQVRAVARESDYSVVTLEKVRGLLVGRADIAASAERLQVFIRDCLGLLQHLKATGVAHQRIGHETLLVRDGRPVLVDFESAVTERAAASGQFSVEGLFDTGCCDIYRMGKLLEQIADGRYPVLDAVLGLMTEPDDSLRTTNLDTLQALLKTAVSLGAWESRLGLWWGKGFESVDDPGVDLEGSRIVVRELLRKASERRVGLRRHTGGEWRERVHLALEEITELIPRGDTFILVDEDLWGTAEDILGRRRIPFLERDGRYWGPPPDDKVAIQELQRLRLSGAKFMAFAWPAFWWLEHYTGLRSYLDAEFRRVLENDRLVVFDLAARET